MRNDASVANGAVPTHGSVPVDTVPLAYGDPSSAQQYSSDLPSGLRIITTGLSQYSDQERTSEIVPQAMEQGAPILDTFDYLPEPSTQSTQVQDSIASKAPESIQVSPLVEISEFHNHEALESSNPQWINSPWHEQPHGHIIQELQDSTRTVHPSPDADYHYTAVVQGPIEHSSSASRTVGEKECADVTNSQPSDIYGAPTDSGYGSVQAKRNLIESIREISTSVRDNLVQDSLETRTLYSEASTLLGPQLDFYVSEFAEELAAVLPRSLSKELLATLNHSLPHLLEAFAIKIGHGDSDQLCRRLMYLVYKYREQISKAIIGFFAYEEEDDDTEREALQAKDMSVADKMSLWQKQEDLPENYGHDEVPWDCQDDENNESDELEGYLGLQEYRETLIRSRAFAWLERAMLREINMEVPGGYNAQSNVRHEILVALNKQVKVTRKEPPETHNLLFELHWLAKFLSEQEYDLAAHEAFPRALVLVGIGDHAWATTCLDYAQTVWPQSGESMVRLIAHLLRQELGDPVEWTLDDNTHLTAKVDIAGKTLEVMAAGNSYALAEVGEILAWLQTAFRTSPEDGISSISPVCRISESQRDDHPDTKICLPPKRCRLFCRGGLSPPRSYHNSCWLSFFRNPALVRGYPIPRHAEAHRGMEMDLGTITELLGTRKISKLTGKLLLKTALAALVPFHQKDGFVYWHLVASTPGDYLSCCDVRLKPLLDKAASSLSPAVLERSRHVVGWSANVQNFTGGPEASYNIGWSGLTQPSPGCVLDKVTITGGSYITAGVSCVLGKRDKAVHTRAREDYIMRLKWIAKKFVVLYDVRDRRAWLVDGTSALLHLVRASLEHDASDSFSSSFLYRPDMLKEAPAEKSGKLASIDVLTNSQNVCIPLFSKPATSREETITGPTEAGKHVTTQTQTYYCFRDRVQGISNVLEQIMAHQADESTKDGIGFRFKRSTRRQLEGFDFMDVATDEDPFWPRITTLKASGRGWVDFTRAIHAITLFGTGFGELIRPVPPSQESFKSCGECQLNTAVPKNQDILAVCVSELQEILKKRGSTNTNPWRLVNDIHWLAPDKTFEACQCHKNSSAKHERMQVLLPASLPKFWIRGFKSPSNNSLASALQGAVLFGHNRRFPLRWKDHGLPEEGTPDVEVEDLENSFRDSGLGSSVGSTSFNDTSQDGSPGRSPLSFPSQNEAYKRNHEQTFASATSEEIAEKRKKLLENEPLPKAVEKRWLSRHGLSTGDSNGGSSRISNVMESMARWKHAPKDE